MVARRDVTRDGSTVDAILRRIEDHDFHPIKEGLTVDRNTGDHGVANLQDDDWRVRTLTIRDLIRLGEAAVPQIAAHLRDDNPHVRQVCAMVLGILRAASAAEALEERLVADLDPVVRSQAAISLGEVGQGLSALRERLENDPSRDVQHQCELAVYRIAQGIKPTPERVSQYAALDESAFETIKVGQLALDFALPDTNGKTWRLSDFLGKRKVALIWIFADWCPVCHREFHELIELEQEFIANDIQIFTLECHDLYRCRVMVGAEDLRPTYWFADRFGEGGLQKLYTERIWWPHLVDSAGSVGASYGVQPMAYVVHSEWINRPSTVLIDEDGIVRLAYSGKYWGDRPTIRQTLEMMLTGRYQFEPPKHKSSR